MSERFHFFCSGPILGVSWMPGIRAEPLGLPGSPVWSGSGPAAWRLVVGDSADAPVVLCGSWVLVRTEAAREWARGERQGLGSPCCFSNALGQTGTFPGQVEEKKTHWAGYWVSVFLAAAIFRRSSFSLGGLERLGTWQDESHADLCGPGPKGLQERAFTIIRALLLFSPSPILQERVLEFYSRTFSVYMNQEGETEDGAEAPDGPEGGACPGCGVPPQQCWCQEALEQLKELSHILWVSNNNKRRDNYIWSLQAIFY